MFKTRYKCQICGKEYSNVETAMNCCITRCRICGKLYDVIEDAYFCCYEKGEFYEKGN